jgi:hypothetical protein
MEKKILGDYLPMQGAVSPIIRKKNGFSKRKNDFLLRLFY